ncbi:MAG: PRC-barrel domain-containing protein [Acidobacteria bacterium]|nr:PRC-barrel domain-containing protein [Acidobacteriota bacterium]MBA3886248.1 PRC-barrel domain-containing protein [Acidobacteriota bacterium]
MRWTHCFAPALALAIALPAATATAQVTQQQTQQQQQTQDPQRPDARVDQQRTGQYEVVRADRIIGQTIRDRNDQRLGRIDDLAINTEDKKVAYAVVTRGGMWGIGGERVALAWDEVRPDHEARVVRLDEQRLQQARRIETGQTWPVNIGDGPVGTAGAAPEHRVLPMSNIIGMDVHNKQGESLGRIDDVVLNRDGSLNYAVIAHGGFLGIGDNYIAVPWDRLTLDAQRQGAVMDVTRDQLDRTERFEYRDGAWPNRVNWPFGGGDAGRDRR